MWFARCHEELGHFEDAEFYYRKSIAIQPKFATAHGRYAEFSWHKLNNIKQAKVHFEKSLKNKENHVTHRFVNYSLFHFGDVLDCIIDDDLDIMLNLWSKTLTTTKLRSIILNGV